MIVFKLNLLCLPKILSFKKYILWRLSTLNINLNSVNFRDNYDLRLVKAYNGLKFHVFHMIDVNNMNFEK